MIMFPASPFFLQNQEKRLILFGGKGGVGKTTCAAATSLHLAGLSPKASFLLVSTDPAHSLADALAGTTPPSNLTLLELDAQRSMERFKREHDEELRQIALKGTFLDEEDVASLLELSLPGLDELMAFLDIARWVETGKYATIIVDTAPTGHTLSLLAMPSLIDRWLQALDTLLAKHRYMRQVFSGRYNLDDLDRFLLDLSRLIKRMSALLQDPQSCRFVPVMLAEELSLNETLDLVAELEQQKVPLHEIVVNKLLSPGSCPACCRERDQQLGVLEKITETFSLNTLIGIPRYAEEVRGGASLERFWDGAGEITGPTMVRNPNLPAQLPRVEQPALPIPEGTTCAIFAGKGGVGKTTLACATALHLAQQAPERRILLFSTDPAHSLADCLLIPLGAEPTPVTAGLSAVEMDARKEFSRLRELYNREVEEFFQKLWPQMDLTFDREVVEKIFDLAPSGLDEIMALSQAIGYLSSGDYDLVILDPAPTGHLVRLLELPELVDRWLKLLFGLFLKYDQIFRLSKVTMRLVAISKDIKHLRQLLSDPQSTSLCAVATPTELAFEETRDLVAACEEIGLSVPHLFLNQVTESGHCPFCTKIKKAERQVTVKFRRSFAEKAITTVYRRGDPRGLLRLRELGQALYQSRASLQGELIR